VEHLKTAMETVMNLAIYADAEQDGACNYPSISRVRKAFSNGALDVMNERERQTHTPGWTQDLEDLQTGKHLAAAAAAFALSDPAAAISFINIFPWLSGGWRPKDPRSNLVLAGALIHAEIERLDRASARSAQGQRTLCEETR